MKTKSAFAWHNNHFLCAKNGSNGNFKWLNFGLIIFFYFYFFNSIKILIELSAEGVNTFAAAKHWI